MVILGQVEHLLYTPHLALFDSPIIYTLYQPPQLIYMNTIK